MSFDPSDKVKGLMERLQAFMDAEIYPNEEIYWDQLNSAADRWQPVPIVETLKPKARAAG
ncbi:MAG: acyl-CoA dehydrogenase, partial [Alphaproteobacteria bacterium]|nr:acyl-CoA dehydrogenase [Alphaproteobacteria bacterium]